MLTNTKAVLFDLDGTLIDSMGLWREIDIEFCENHGFKMPEDLQKQIEGLSMYETADYFINTFNLNYSNEELMDIWNEMAEDAYRNSIELKNGAIEFLDFLKENKIKTAVATSNSKRLVNACFEGTGLKNYIDLFVTANEVAAGKPAPDVYLEAARRLDVAPEYCLVFEDIIPGIEAGHNAAMRVCAIYDSYSKDIDNIKREQSDYYINDYFEILENI